MPRRASVGIAQVALALALWAQSCASLVVFDKNSVLISDEFEFLAALQDVSVQTIYVYAPVLKMSASVWQPGVVTVSRSVVITVQYPGVDEKIIDATEASRGAVSCVDNCVISLRGPSLTVLNGVPPTVDFSSATPLFVAVRFMDGTLEMSDMDVVSMWPSGLWYGSSIVYLPQNTWWVGNMSITCSSTTEVVINYWLSYNKERGLYLNVTGGNNFVGWIKLINTRMRLKQSYVCSSFNATTCNGVLQVCNSTKSTAPLPLSSCSPQAISGACHPDPPLSLIDPDGSLAPTHAGSNNSKGRLWWVGLLVGLVGGGLLLGGLAAFLWHRRSTQQPGSPASTNKSMQILAPSQDTCATPEPEDSLPAIHNLTIVGGEKHISNSTGRASSSFTTPPSTALHISSNTAEPISSSIVVLAPSYNETAPMAKESIPICAMCAGVSTLVDGRSQALMKSSQLSTPCSSKGPAVTVLTPSTVMETTGFSYQGSMSDMTMADQQTGSPLVNRNVIIGMAPTTPTGISQLTRNPLGVTLHALLGSGAFGTVYSGVWNGQDVAVKVMVQKVDDDDDLAAILQFREATLGAELQHPRIVRTLAHALVLPEGMLSDEGLLLRPGMVEAHIVSALCDRGTLRAWLQQTRNAGNNMGMLNSAQGPRSQRSRLVACQQPMSLPKPVKSRPLSDSGWPVLVFTQHTSKSLSLQERRQPDVVASQMLQVVDSNGRRSTELLAKMQPVGLRAGCTSEFVLRHEDSSGMDAEGFCGRNKSEISISRGSSGTETQLTTCAMSHVSTFNTLSGTLNFIYPPLAGMHGLAEPVTGLHGDFKCHMVAVVDVLLEIADGLSYLLSKGVVHGDLKPQNCLCCTDSDALRGFTIRICDFGISRVLHGSKSHTTVSHPPGTLAYFAPELLSTCHLSPACDLYSFGIIMYELVACKQPLANLTMAQVLYKKATGQVDEYLVFPPETPMPYIQLARACYSLEASSRPSLQQVFSILFEIRQHLLEDWHLPILPPPAPSVIGTEAVLAASTSPGSR